MLKTKKKYVFVTYDPLIERVICVHEKYGTRCNSCKKLKSGDNSSYFWREQKFLIKK